MTRIATYNAVNPAEVPAAGEVAPTAYNLTKPKSVTAMIYAVPESDPDLVYIDLNDRDQAWHDLYKIKISTGGRILINSS
ncbi:MAG: hypothetical protein ACREVK_02690 [Gammaproteobacteria bacterium]